MSAAALLLAACLAQTQPAPKPPYSLPFQLRPTAAVTVARFDNMIAPNQLPNGADATTYVSFGLVSYKVTPQLSPFARFGVVGQSAPNDVSGVALTNPALGATYALELIPNMRLGLTLAAALPLGSGGGNTPNPNALAAIRAGPFARAAMDNAMFAVNDLVIFGGAGLSHQWSGFTLQGEVTVFSLTRVKGELAQPDDSRVNFTSGLHLGYFVHPRASVGVEARYQRWLSTPAAVVQNPAARQTFTGAAGVRLHFPWGEGHFIRPGVSYAQAFDDPMESREYHLVQLDVPVIF